MDHLCSNKIKWFERAHISQKIDQKHYESENDNQIAANKDHQHPAPPSPWNYDRPHHQILQLIVIAFRSITSPISSGQTSTRYDHRSLQIAESKMLNTIRWIVVLREISIYHKKRQKMYRELDAGTNALERYISYVVRIRYTWSMAIERQQLLKNPWWLFVFTYCVRVMKWNPNFIRLTTHFGARRVVASYIHTMNAVVNSHFDIPSLRFMLKPDSWH